MTVGEYLKKQDFNEEDYQYLVLLPRHNGTTYSSYHFKKPTESQQAYIKRISGCKIIGVMPYTLNKAILMGRKAPINPIQILFDYIC